MAGLDGYRATNCARHLLEALLKYNPHDREIYKKEWVVDVSDARLAVRNYLEQRDLRKYLALANERHKITTACEFGCGYGRMTQVLTEFATQVDGVERETSLVQEAASLIPGVNFHQRDDLSRTGLPSVHYDVILTFTFLQHLIDAVAEQVAREMIRCLKPGGHVLICEETDIDHQMGDPGDPNRICTIGRSIAQYRHLFAPLELVTSGRRQIEPAYERADAGDYLLFQLRT